MTVAWHSLALAAVLWFGGALTPFVMMAQDPPPAPAPCSSTEHRQFDFWLGAWNVHSVSGDLLGTNVITRVGQCGLLERWRGKDGSEGVSVNAWDPARLRWTQRWVGAGGAILWLEGELNGGSMVLTGADARSTPRGAVIDRISWTPLPDGRVRQVWDISPQGASGWTTIFEGYYSRTAEQVEFRSVTPLP